MLFQFLLCRELKFTLIFIVCSYIYIVVIHVGTRDCGFEFDDQDVFMM